ncbi:OsmC family protein [Halobacterium salinarum]|uniref:OsmC family protein n=1 Tax=Halobacterium salinarum TaxID=2242 RepID=UPI002555FE6D|nr:OsmC family protein [Halobacterium salinarum]MDL0134377.1 OsmC family protein [Halobacterium salinarum]
MTIEVTSTSADGYTTQSRIGDFELTIDATDEDGPNPNATLLADYASCFIPAFRVGGQKEGFDDLGRIDIDVEGDIDDDDDLSAIRFHLLVEEDLDDEFDAVVDRAEDICHVHAALREELHAEISGETGAF